MSTGTKHGVLSDSSLTYYQGNVLQKQRIDQQERGLAGLCRLALEYQLTHLWVMPDLQIVPDKAFYEAALDEWDLLATWNSDEEVSTRLHTPRFLRSVTGWKLPKGGQKQINVIWPKHTKWEWAQAENLTAKQLLWLVAHLEHALGIPVGGGPGTVGWKYLLKVNAGHPEWMKSPSADLSELPFRDASKQILWDRVPTAEELKGKYLVKVDKNSMYLRACVEELYGVNSPSWVGSQAYSDKAVGIWRITARGENNPMLPPPLWERAEWVATPIVKMLRKLGYEVAIYEGWRFPEAHGVLKNWATNLWDIRKQYPLGDMRNGAIKEIANRTIGLASYTRFEEVTDKYRPDWRCQTVAGAYAVMFYNMLKFAEQGYYPVLVSTDAILFCCDTLPDLPYQGSLGGFKHVWTLPLNEEVKAVLTAPTDGKKAAMKMGKLNAIAKREK